MTRLRESLRDSGTLIMDVGLLNQRVLLDSFQTGPSIVDNFRLEELAPDRTQRLQMPIMLASISVAGGIAVCGPSGLNSVPVALTVTTGLLEIRPRPAAQTDSRSDDQIAVDRFVNEGGPPASTFCTKKKNVVT